MFTVFIEDKARSRTKVKVSQKSGGALGLCQKYVMEPFSKKISIVND